jgi:hypothetical protein
MLWVRVSDGNEWSPWSESFTVTAPVDTGPVVNSVTSILTTAGQTFAASALFTTSEPFGDAIEQYDFWDIRSFKNPSFASSAATSRRDRWCPFGERRRKTICSQARMPLASAAQPPPHVKVDERLEIRSPQMLDCL